MPVPIPSTGPGPHLPLTPNRALRAAWVIWLALLLVPFVPFLLAIWSALTSWPAGTTNQELADSWFVAMLIYLALVVPASFFWRGWLFRGYWHGVTVPPRTYLIGMTMVWAPLSLAGLLAAVGCLASHTLGPNIGAAGVALVLYMTLWPTGRAMTHPVGDEDDAEIYQEPR